MGAAGMMGATGQGETPSGMKAQEGSLRFIVAGMLSTIDFRPSQEHPSSMLFLADQVIHHIRLADAAETRGEPGQMHSIPHDADAERPF